ncbi:MAG: hypothetical protein LBE09_08070 [Christensenellaceae bacterium]|jgi:paraquat-inducible protein B|nr:hypothetical protein [Christensenellaceae bacterium]
MQADQVSTPFDGLTSKLGKVQSTAQKVPRIVTAMLTSLAVAATPFATIGEELDDTNKKFSISPEQLQLQRNLYAKNTDNAQNYDKALSSLNSVMSSIAKGRGACIYRNAI